MLVVIAALTTIGGVLLLAKSRKLINLKRSKQIAMKITSFGLIALGIIIVMGVFIGKIRLPLR